MLSRNLSKQSAQQQMWSSALQNMFNNVIMVVRREVFCKLFSLTKLLTQDTRRMPGPHKLLVVVLPLGHSARMSHKRHARAFLRILAIKCPSNPPSRSATNRKVLSSNASPPIRPRRSAPAPRFLLSPPRGCASRCQNIPVSRFLRPLAIRFLSPFAHRNLSLIYFPVKK